VTVSDADVVREALGLGESLAAAPRPGYRADFFHDAHAALSRLVARIEELERRLASADRDRTP